MTRPTARFARPRLRIACFVAVAALATTVAFSAPDFTVVQKNQEFSVRHLTIKAGDRVTFVNNDAVTHNVYSDTKGLAFEIELQPPGRADTVQFSSPGVAEVRCAIHPNMRLSVAVKK
ncbi:MAG: cupredoxin domain-containing protein [Betaproteobacteria bacterium]